MQSGKEYVVDIDLAKFFDRVNHDRLIYLLSGHVPDKRILRIIGIILINGTMILTKEGTVQGSPLRPLLSNFILKAGRCLFAETGRRIKFITLPFHQNSEKP